MQQGKTQLIFEISFPRAFPHGHLKAIVIPSMNSHRPELTESWRLLMAELFQSVSSCPLTVPAFQLDGARSVSKFSSCLLIISAQALVTASRRLTWLWPSISQSRKHLLTCLWTFYRQNVPSSAKTWAWKRRNWEHYFHEVTVSEMQNYIGRGLGGLHRC